MRLPFITQAEVGEERLRISRWREAENSGRALPGTAARQAQAGRKALAAKDGRRASEAAKKK